MDKVDPPVEVRMDLNGHQQTAVVVAGRVPEQPVVVQKPPRGFGDVEPDEEAKLVGSALFGDFGPEVREVARALASRGGPPESKEVRLAVIEQRRSLEARARAVGDAACEALLKALGLSGDGYWGGPPFQGGHMRSAVFPGETEGESFFQRFAASVSQGWLGTLPRAEHDQLLETLWCNRVSVQGALEALHGALRELFPDPVVEL